MLETNRSADLAAIARDAMIERGLEPTFPPDALRQVGDISGPARENADSIRDLRSLLWCSIDNDTSKDLDQLSVIKETNGEATTILVAIADVDVLVQPGTPVDRHAERNTTSVYTATTIFPMLPERLSTDLTSLADGQERLAIVIEMTVAKDGSVTSSDIYRASVVNRAKLAYRSVAAWLEGTGAIPSLVANVPGMDEQIRGQDRVAQALRKVRYQHGALDLETIEPEAILNEGRLVGLRVDADNRARDLIEDFMIAANGVSAQFLEKRKLPSLRRVIREPEHWDRIREVAHDLGEPLPANPDAKALASFLTKRRQADPLHFPDLSLTIVKLLGAGEYVLQLPGQESPGHFGLAVRQYSHSTAPNRRFPDLITQRLLKAALANKPAPYEIDRLTALADHCTTQEDAAKKVERRVRKSAAALLLSGKIGENFDAIVTGQSQKGTWVRLLNPPAEGRLMRGERGVRIGDKIRVQLSSLNVERGFIDFTRF